MTYRNRLSIVSCVASLVFAVGETRAIEAAARSAALASITTAEVAGHVNVLADDTFEGREAGSRGNRAAAVYIIERLKKYGLEGGGARGSFYQTGGGTNNILALVEGSHAALKDEVILVGAHYDHVGYGNYRNSYGPIGRIHNGADDNASGVAALLEVAEAVSLLPKKPRRSILFAFWDGEEKGLLGSKYWIDHPTMPLDKLRLAVNVDMIGRLRKSRLEVYGARTGVGLRRLVSRQNEPELLLDFNWDIKPDSDHYTFYSHAVPFVMLHTGMHGDYHRPSDDAEKINSEGLKQISQLMFGVVVALADADELAGFRRQSGYESRSGQTEAAFALRPPTGRLGIRWEEAAERDGRIVVAAVVPGSPAAVAGLKNGDRLLTFAGHEVRDPRRFRMSVLTATNPVSVSIERRGEEKPLNLTLQLSGEPVRLGIAWRTDDAEPGAVIVNRVTPGSPSDVAGLRPGDRIYSVNGREFKSSDEFHELATSQPAPLILEVETSGRVRSVEIPQVEVDEAKAAGAAGAAPAGNSSSGIQRAPFYFTGRGTGFREAPAAGLAISNSSSSNTSVVLGPIGGEPCSP
jgi:hypothetical protein